MNTSVHGSFVYGACRIAGNGKHRLTERRTVFPVNGLAKEEGKGGRKRFLAALEMTAWGMAIPCIIQRTCGEKHVSRIVIPSGVEGSFSLMVRRRVSDSEERETPYRGKWKRRVSRIVIPSEVEGSFSLAVRRSVFDSEERETPCRGKAGAVFPINGLAKEKGKGGRKRFLAA